MQIVSDLIRGHFDRGGTLININVLDGEKLMRANENPDLYPDLVVRVTGFTAYFASLSPRFRQLVVDRFLKQLILMLIGVVITILCFAVFGAALGSLFNGMSSYM